MSCFSGRHHIRRFPCYTARFEECPRDQRLGKSPRCRLFTFSCSDQFVYFGLVTLFSIINCLQHTGALHKSLQILLGQDPENSAMKSAVFYSFLEKRAYELLLYDQKLIDEFAEYKVQCYQFHFYYLKSFRTHPFSQT